ncbi:hypothetical protein P175DRAFT_0512121 [Aspergillus ochraceoroseus IBT 24754]|uniref:Rhodopsin domain-containing protein n=1 Tax=Aspergillus ochraceoroseus IBT 24754 TaxID=1392256 RepID=A0A2T5LNU7_9EURO|nr:uncharacterized protein P175DRAFT_0512121 [Aspergillus ochraceoroseus IBT 24754]PTU17935.1 hypothetical protein P175DRAFT_0512121 [Aspergillus ochraceoroseus IBT 24754]
MPSDVGDSNYGMIFIIAACALTALVTVTLIFRYSVKAWVSWKLPNVSSPERIWGAEDLYYIVGYGFDIAHMAMVQKSLEFGLGQHMSTLTVKEITGAMKYDFLSQPLAIVAAMVSRCGMMWFLHTCFGSGDKKIHFMIVVCLIIQIVVNMVTVVQVVVQCGPNPYRVANRAAYFHYMWDGVPADGSVVCQSSSVQTTIGFVQGGINSAIDFFLTILAGVQLWQYSIRAVDGTPAGGSSFLSRFKRMPKSARNRRIWQTVILSGPLALSGCASIVKTIMLKSLGERNDFTHNIVPFILWVKIENYSILLASCGPVIRLFVRIMFDRKKGGSKWGYWSNSRSNQYGHGLDLDQLHTQNQGSVVMTVFGNADKGPEGEWDPSRDEQGASLGHHSRGEQASPQFPGVTVKTDITVQVDSDGASTKRLVQPKYDT